MHTAQLHTAMTAYLHSASMGVQRLQADHIDRLSRPKLCNEGFWESFSSIFLFIFESISKFHYQRVNL
jgi:hypothetical protein